MPVRVSCTIGALVVAGALTVGCDRSAPLPETVYLRISGMHCESCVAALTDALRAVPSALEVGVSLEGECARVVLAADGAEASRALEVVEAVTGLGYEATPTEAPCEVPDSEARDG